VSLDRVNDFLLNVRPPLTGGRFTNMLQKTELLDEFTPKIANEFVEAFSQEDSRIKEDSVGFRKATFTWSPESDGSTTSSGRTFTLRIEEEILFKKGGINLIVGPTGSGKTSLLMALLGSWM
jgi:ABC-type multidrug transport system fused ATPase/permease subunit